MEKRRRGNRPVPATTVSDLPIPILMDIFSRLPIKTVFICGCVSKTWLNVVSAPEFRQTHGSICPLLRTLNPQRRSRALHMVPIDTAGDLDEKLNLLNSKLFLPNSNSRKKEFSRFRSRREFDVVNSCNGLLCLRTPKCDDSVMVCNPVTGEYVSIPKSKREHRWSTWPQYIGVGVTGFGFSSRTCRYKVIRLVNLQVSAREAEIFTLGEDSWRSIGPPLFPLESSATVFLKGAVHWLCTESTDRGSVHWLCTKSTDTGLITSFNSEDEKFGEIPSPFHYGRGRCNMRMGVLGECLYLTDIAYYDRFEVWVMKEYGVQDSWTKEFVIENKGLYVWPRGLYQPIKYLQNGDVLMFHPSNALVAYNPQKKCFRYFKIKGIQSDFEAISFAPSLVSLRESLMGKNVEVGNFNSRCPISEIWEDNEALHFVEEDKTKELDPYWIGYPLI